MCQTRASLRSVLGRSRTGSRASRSSASRRQSVFLLTYPHAFPIRLAQGITCLRNLKQSNAVRFVKVERLIVGVDQPLPADQHLRHQLLEREALGLHDRGDLGL